MLDDEENARLLQEARDALKKTAIVTLYQIVSLASVSFLFPGTEIVMDLLEVGS